MLFRLKQTKAFSRGLRECAHQFWFFTGEPKKQKNFVSQFHFKFQGDISQKVFAWLLED